MSEVDPFSSQETELTPEEFERFVADHLAREGKDEPSLQVTHREQLSAHDGDYEIDVVARFEKLGAKFVILVECKHQKSFVKRDVVQVLADRLRATGAHKGMIFATSHFQKGAIAYAKEHGIALVRITNGEAAWITATGARLPEGKRNANGPRFIGWLVGLSSDGNQEFVQMGA